LGSEPEPRHSSKVKPNTHMNTHYPNSLKVSEVPYPFTSREQYERAMRRPVGKEWNTALAVRDQTRPAVKVGWVKRKGKGGSVVWSCLG
jgi:U3 small nucleolar RNA-associated protein 14